MQYIADSNGCIKSISFGATVACDGVSCVEYTGSVPTGYESVEDWYMSESETLYRWKIVGGNLTLDEDATEPEKEWVNPPMELGVVYRTAERYDGKPVYVCRFALELPNSSVGGSYEIASPVNFYGARILEQKVTRRMQKVQILTQKATPQLQPEKILTQKVGGQSQHLRISTYKASTTRMTGRANTPTLLATAQIARAQTLTPSIGKVTLGMQARSKAQR